MKYTRKEIKGYLRSVGVLHNSEKYVLDKHHKRVAFCSEQKYARYMVASIEIIKQLLKELEPKT